MTMGRLGTRPTRDGRGRETPRRNVNDGEEGTPGARHTIAPSNFRFFEFFGESISNLGRASNKTAWSKIARARLFFFCVLQLMVINRWASSLEKKTYTLARSCDEKHDPPRSAKGRDKWDNGTNGDHETTLLGCCFDPLSLLVCVQGWLDSEDSDMCRGAGAGKGRARRTMKKTKVVRRDAHSHSYQQYCTGNRWRLFFFLLFQGFA